MSTPETEGGSVSTTSPKRSYDTIQAEAVLVTCAGCGGQWYMTHVETHCRLCRVTSDAGAALFRRLAFDEYD